MKIAVISTLGFLALSIEWLSLAVLLCWGIYGTAKLLAVTPIE